jgi:hypothetical protein
MGEGAVPRLMKRIWIPVIISILAISALTAPKTYAVAPSTALPVNASPALSGASPEGFTTSSVAEYIELQAILAGINPIDAQWIVNHESQDGQNLSGDDGQSIGYWMISEKYHPEVGRACSLSLQCSTAWSMRWIAKGHITEWSTWACRYAWYPDATSTLGPALANYEEPKYCKGASSN